MRYAILAATMTGFLFAAATFAQQPTDSVVSDANNNTAMGSGALLHNQTSTDNTAAGASTLISNTTGYSNTAYGSNAMVANSTGYENTGFGYGSLYRNTTGFDNTAIGIGSLNSETTGSQNTALGTYALYSTTTPYGNLAAGSHALFSNTTGVQNVALGDYALASSTVTYGNTGAGAQALYLDTTGSLNSAFGHTSLESNTTGDNNSGYGFQSLLSNTTGNDNAAFGYNALGSNVAGSANIAIGYNAGYGIVGSNNIDIGAAGLSTDNGFIRIGTKGTHKAALIEGIYTTSLQVNSLPVFVNAAGRLSVGMPSERYKTGIVTMDDQMTKLQQLRPVTFHLKTEPLGTLQYGLIAEEVAKIYPELVVRDPEGRIQGVRYDELAPMLLNEVQKQQRINAAQLADNETQATKIAALQQQLSAIQVALAGLVLKDKLVARR